ncbi:hypothetical protein PINS_up015323 [Pythium insidiosum]|nr:hypothetical protein PINS_up015323 [Pythium insidiosum]
MSRSSQQLEQEIAQMEDRLAQAKAVAELEKVAWKKVARKGKHGAKWKGAAPAPIDSSNNSSAPRFVSAAASETTEDPTLWDPLELAQHLQSHKLTAFAQIVIHEQITGKLLLDTAPGKLKQLFGALAPTPRDAWASFLQVCSELHKTQKATTAKRRSEDTSVAESKTVKAAPSTATEKPPPLFPAISPRGLAVGERKSNTTSDDLPGVRRAARQAPAMPAARKLVSQSQLTATCWNCGLRFPRPTAMKGGGGGIGNSNSNGSSNGLNTRPVRVFCSASCQEAIERSDMSVSASLSMAVRLQPDGGTSFSGSDSVERPSPRNTTVKSQRVPHQPLKPPPPLPSSQFDFLHVARQGPSADEMPRPPVHRAASNSSVKRSLLSLQPGASVASITGIRTLPDDALHGAVHATTTASASGGKSPTHGRVPKAGSSLYRLDPELLGRRGSFAECFDVSIPESPTQQRRRVVETRVSNLLLLVEFLSLRGLHRLSLTSKRWYDTLTQNALIADAAWSWQLRTRFPEHVPESGDRRRGAAERPRRALRQLVRQLQRVVLENLKTLSQADNWLLATVCPRSSAAPEFITERRRARELLPPRHEIVVDQDTGREDALHDLFETISVVLDGEGAIVAIRAQDLVRPVDEQGSVVDVLQGLRAATLVAVDCRRLRLFSTTNRLPFDEWFLLPHVASSFDFCRLSPDDNGDRHRVRLERRAPDQGDEGDGDGDEGDEGDAVDGGGGRLSRWQRRVLQRLETHVESRLMSKDSVLQVLRVVQERSAPQRAVQALEKFLVQHQTALRRRRT